MQGAYLARVTTLIEAILIELSVESVWTFPFSTSRSGYDGLERTWDQAVSIRHWGV